MASADRAVVWIIALLILAAFLFSGDPDLTDALAKRLSGCG
jgi:hypothetical protein